MNRLTVLVLCVLAAGAATAAPPTPLDAELERIVALLPGRYQGVAPDPADPSAPPRPIYHKIVRVTAPQFGSDAVFYHQLARDGFDSAAPVQQKIYAFDRDPGRAANRMRAAVFYPSSGVANLERDPAALAALDPGTLLRFPEPCTIRWYAEGGGADVRYVARVPRGSCSYPSRGFGQDVSPDLTYVLTAGAFTMQDHLYGADGRPLVPESGPLVAERLGDVAAARLDRGRAAVQPFQLALQSALQAGMARGPAAAVDACRTRAPAIALEAAGPGVELGRSSHRLRNPANAPRPWVRPLLDDYVAGGRAPRVVDLGGGRFGYVEPILTQPLCVACHGAQVDGAVAARIAELYPRDEATGFAAGDLRGLFWAEFAR